MKGVLSFIIPSISESCIKVLLDNDGAISLANSPLSSARIKHIDMRFHFIRELTRSKTISVEYVPTKKQRADILTKALTGAIFKQHRDFLMNLHRLISDSVYLCDSSSEFHEQMIVFSLAPDDYYV